MAGPSILLWTIVGVTCLLPILAEPPKTVVYYVDVTTTNESFAGTDADVFIQIFGSYGNTTVRQLKKSGNLYETGHTDSFFFIDNYVGQISHIGIKRNTEGLWDSWKLQRVIVKGLLPLHYKFDFNQWIPAGTWVYSYGGD